MFYKHEKMFYREVFSTMKLFFSYLKQLKETYSLGCFAFFPESF